MKKIITVLLVIMLFTSTIPAAYATDIIGIPYVKTNNMDDINFCIDICKERKSYAHEMANSARSLGYQEESVIIQTAKAEWWDADNVQTQYVNDLIKLQEQWQEKAEQYPTATYVWTYFRDLGYNNAVIAGIIGNMMAETSGNSLKLNYRITSPGGKYYGLCQWNHTYPGVWGCGLEEQCDFLRDTIEYEFNTYGYMYYRGFKYEDFLNITDCEDAAKAFAAVYERCGSSTYGARQKNSITAFDYFTDFE